jgi:16S rRNA (uracil1498-N3)-methyltransferase
MTETPARAAGEPGARAHVFVAALDDDVTVGDGDARHLARVRRLRPGEVLTAADGSGAWRRYTVASTTRTSLELRADGERHVEPALRPGLVAAVALLPHARIDALIAPLGELGVDRLVLVETARTQAAPPAPARVARLQTLARESAMQCRRARPMAVGECLAFERLLATRRPDDRVVVAAPDGGPARAVDAPPHGGAWIVLSGPEGGFAPDEITQLADASRLALGPHVLRAETAPVAAAAVLTQRRG